MMTCDGIDILIDHDELLARNNMEGHLYLVCHL